MIMKASARPKGLKRGVTTKKVHETLGFDSEVGINTIVMQLNLTAENRNQGMFLKEFVDALYEGRTIEIKNAAGDTKVTYGTT